MPSNGHDLNAGAAILARLKTLGIDYFFVNSGTDFPPIIEGMAEAAAKAIELPRPIIVPHEHAAMGLAHGYYFATGRGQAVMLHTNVGLSNGAVGAVSAAHDHVPMLIMSGRTPTLEQGRFGARTTPIGWGQEMRDQTAFVREAVKWDYELRFPEQVGDVVDRAYTIANSTPKGPVYLALPREVLTENYTGRDLDAPLLMAPAAIEARNDDIEQAADMLAAAERPLIVAQRGAGSADGFAALGTMTEDWAIPVCQYWSVANAVATSHPTYVGGDLEPWLSEADVILVIDSMAPWSPGKPGPEPDCKVIHLGPNPLHTRTPIRNFRSDLSITSETGPALVALQQAMARRLAKRKQSVAERGALVETRVTAIREAILEDAEKGDGSPMSKAWVSKCLGDALRGQKATVLSELGCLLEPIGLDEYNSWRQEPHSGGLGWSFPAAMGMKLALHDRLIVATMGDGSYMFSNPVVCHQVSEAYDLPVLIIITNNAEWGAVRQSVLGLYPDGHAAKANAMPLTGLSPSPDFTLVAKASRAHAETVTEGSALPAALERAIHAVMVEKRQALLDVRVS